MYLFDFDGTLVDSNGVWVEIDNGFLARRGLTPTREYSDTVGHSIFPIAAQFTKDYYCLDMKPEAIMAEWLDMARDAYARQVPMKPGAEAFLARCAAAGEPMALLTACVPELCRAALARHRLEGYFRQIIFGEAQPGGLHPLPGPAGGRGRGLHPLRGLPRRLPGGPGCGHPGRGGV